MEPFISRILIQHVQGATIAYLYNRESFELLKIDRQQYDNSQFIEIGQVIEYNEKKYKVESVNFKMEEKLYKMDPSVGFNMYAPTDPSDFNCQIGVFVDNAE
ncbi:MAG: hypothetical protein ACK417_10065 [Bacteroidia bacterium]